MLSRDDIVNEIIAGRLKIYPFDMKNLTGIGYNLSTTDFAFSTNQGVLLTIQSETTGGGKRHYVTIPHNDTVLFFSKEYIEIDNSLAGTFHSKVSRVCEGLGAISSTLDATWKGQLLISVNNPTSRNIRFYLDRAGGNVMTLILHKLETAVTGNNIHDNNKGRCELLIAHLEEPPSGSALCEKHLMLKAFVEKELADSLNGFDSFLQTDYPRDQYSDAVNKMQTLRERLNSDLISINEGKYLLGENGQYSSLKCEEEKDLIEHCTLAKLAKQYKQYDKNPPVQITMRRQNDLDNAQKEIEYYLKIIDYELKTIDHIRRINWHNAKVSTFASEDSELVLLRKKNAQRKFNTKITLLALLTVVFIACVVAIFAFADKTSSIFTALIAIYSAALPSMILVWRWLFKDGKN